MADKRWFLYFSTTTCLTLSPVVKQVSLYLFSPQEVSDVFMEVFSFGEPSGTLIPVCVSSEAGAALRAEQNPQTGVF